MKNPSQDDLLGYVLGALDAQEQRNVQQSIDDNPEIEEQLLRIKNALLPLDCLETSGPRPGLARRTCEAVAGWQCERDWDSFVDSPGSSAIASFDSIRSPLGEPAPIKALPKLRTTVSERILHPRTWSIPDVLVGMALIAIMAGILFPTISHTRYASRVAACQSNLSQVGFALMDYSSANEGRCMVVPPDSRFNVIGWIGPTLKDAGLIEDDSIFSCPGIAASLPPVHIPSGSQIKNATSDDLIDHYCHTACGHFGFTMGYWDNGRYYPPRVGRSNVVLFADRPSCSPGRVSLNHGNNGQNLVFGDGRVEFVKGPAFGEDAIYENDYGFVGPGSGARDNVVAPSYLSLDRANKWIELIRSESH